MKEGFQFQQLWTHTTLNKPKVIIIKKIKKEKKENIQIEKTSPL